MRELDVDLCRKEALPDNHSIRYTSKLTLSPSVCKHDAHDGRGNWNSGHCVLLSLVFLTCSRDQLVSSEKITLVDVLRSSKLEFQHLLSLNLGIRITKGACQSRLR